MVDSLPKQRDGFLRKSEVLFETAVDNLAQLRPCCLLWGVIPQCRYQLGNARHLYIVISIAHSQLPSLYKILARTSV